MKRVWIIPPIIFSLIVYAGLLLNSAPATAQSVWVQLEPNPTGPRTGHSIARIGDDCPWGGCGSEWVQLPGNQPPPRTGHSLVQTGDDVFSYGVLYEWGCCGSEWAQLPGSQPPPRTGHSIARIGNDAYIYGGTNGTTVFQDLWKFNYETGWAQVQFPVTDTVPGPLHHHQAVWLTEGGVDKMYLFYGMTDDPVFPYVSGGRTTVYNLATNTFTRAPSGASFPGGSIYASATPLNGEIWLYGGKMGDDVLGDLWNYNPLSGSWASVSYYPFRPLFGHAAVPYNGKIYVFGGHDGNEAKGELRCFDPDTRRWTTIATVDTPEALYLSASGFLEADANVQRNSTAAQTGGWMWLVGGKNSNGEDVSNVWEFNFVTNQWRELTPLPEPRSNAGLAVFPNPAGTVTLVVFGGERDGVPIAGTLAMTLVYTIYIPLVMR